MQTHPLMHHKAQPLATLAAAVALVVGLVGFGICTSLAPSDQQPAAAVGTVATVPAAETAAREPAVLASDPDQAPPPLGPVDVVPAPDATLPCEGCGVEPVRPVAFRPAARQQRQAR